MKHTKHIPNVFAVALIVIVSFVNHLAHAQHGGASFDRLPDIAFPVGPAVINIKQAPYHAKGDGETDDTKSIQRAVDDLMGKHRILYFPEGEYIVSQTIRWSKKNSDGSDAWGHNWLQGQNANKTRIKLKAGVFTDVSQPQSIMWCGGFGSADWFHNYIEDITFDVGENNPGAIALQFYSNNYGAIRNCRFTDSTTRAAIGLDLGFQDMNGPLLVKNCEVSGFRVGVKAGHAVNGQTFEALTLLGQSEVGFINEGQSIAISNLRSHGKVPAIKTYGSFALVGANLEGLPGAESHPGVLNFNGGRLYIRDLKTTGYARAVVNLVTPDQSAAYRLQPDEQPQGIGPNLGELSSEAPLSLFGNLSAPWRLPVLEPPTIKSEPSLEWANVVDFGADPTGAQDASAAIQKAIDSGANTVFFPGFFRLKSTVVIRANVSRVIGTGGWVDYEEQTSPDFKIADGKSSFVQIEHLSSINGGVQVDTSRTVLFKSIGAHRIWFSRKAYGGKLFLEDVTTNNLEFNQQHVWARQLNVENEGLHISNQKSDLWVLGYKTERGGTLLRTTGGGRSEILGGFSYTTTAGGLAPMFVTENSKVFAFFGEVCYSGDPFKTIVREVQRGIEKVVERGSGETLPYQSTAE